MKVFLCWSGERSRKVAEIFKDRLPLMIQTVEPWSHEIDNFIQEIDKDEGDKIQN